MSNSPPQPPAPDWSGLQQLVRILRGPEGCPWDRQQTLSALAGHLVEESFEVLAAAEAMERTAAASGVEAGPTSPPAASADGDRPAAGVAGDPPAAGAAEAGPALMSTGAGTSGSGLDEELGDAFFLLALVQSVAEERGGRPIEILLAQAVSKIVRRHAHVFQPGPEVDARTAALQWEARKREERSSGAAEAEPAPPGTVTTDAHALPALLQAQRLQEKAALVGFDWAEPAPIIEKIEEEMIELRQAMAVGGPQGPARVEEELGDLLFAVVNLARRLGIHPELALRRASTKFRRRYNHMAELASAQGTPLGTIPLAQMDALWQEVKRREDGPSGSPSDPPSPAGGLPAPLRC